MEISKGVKDDEQRRRMSFGFGAKVEAVESSLYRKCEAGEDEK